MSAQGSMDESVKCWVALNMVLGVGKTLFHRLVSAFGSPEDVFRASSGDLMRVEGIGQKIAAEVQGFDIDRVVEREFRVVEKIGARILTVNCPEYPKLLQSIYDPPPVIYCRGKPLDRYAVPVAVVGSRLPTSYGKNVARRLCSGLASLGICIVSGMARGIDTLAHRAALESGGDTIAVFGCGLANTYPPENASLKERIVEQGTIVSEFPVTMRPERNNFPARNRLISGLSHGALIIEAGEKSGALITAQFALEQGREVFAVPGNIYSPKSLGTNRLIQMGARLVDGPEAVVEELGLETQALLKNPDTGSIDISSLTSNEQRLISLLSFDERHIDSLIESSNLSAAEVSATLMQLELRGLVRQNDGKMFVSNANTDT